MSTVADPDPNPRLTPELEASLRGYVLGGLEEDARSQLEEQLVAEPYVFEALGVVEDELIEEYLDGGTDLDRAAFERNFLTSPARAARVKLAKSLRARASRSLLAATPSPLPRAAWWQPALIGLAAALVLSLAGNLWLVFRPESRPATTALSPRASPVVLPDPRAVEHPAAALSTPHSAEELAAMLKRQREVLAQAEARAAALEESLRRSRSSVSFVLASGALRSGGSLQRIEVPRDVLLVHLRLELSGDDHPFFRAVLLNDAGEELWTASKLEAEGASGQRAVVLRLTPDRLGRGDYQVKLSGLSAGNEAEAVGSYAFRVTTP